MATATSNFIRLLWEVFFAWMPTSLQIIFGAFIAIAAIVLVLKIIAMVLDAIPFL